MITGGKILFEGTDLLSLKFEQMREYRGKRIAYVFQDPNSSLHPLHNICDQLIESIKVHDGSMGRRALEAKAVQLLKDVRIASPEHVMKSYPHELSGGMRQRVGIAIALANDPELIIADEPTTALDVTVQAQILHILKRLQRERGLALLFISHDMNVVAQISDRIAVMYAGQIVEAGSTKAVLEKPRHPYTKALLDCLPQLGKGQTMPRAINGSPPLLEDLPDGCAFAPRCSFVTPACQKRPIDVNLIGDRSLRCIRMELDDG